MAWKFDPILLDLIWTGNEMSTSNALVAMGTLLESDLAIDAGLRENDSAVFDQGDRVLDGNI